MRWSPSPGQSPGSTGIEVEILEDDPGGVEQAGARPATGAAAAQDEGGRAPRRWGRRATVAAVILSVVAGVNVVHAQREEARLAALADVPGLLPPLDGPLQPVWDLPGHFNGVAGDLVLVDGDEGLRAVDPATGEVVWSRPAGRGAGDCRPVLHDARLPSPPVHDRGAVRRDVLVCGAYFGSARARSGPITVVDAGTGERLHAFNDGTGLIDAVPVDETALVVVAATPGGRLWATRWDTATGQEEWTFITPGPMPGLLSLQLEEIRLEGDVYVLQAGYPVAFDLVTGRAVDADTAPDHAGPPSTARAALGGGDVAVWRPDGDQGHVEDADGRVLFRLPGPLWRTEVHDGSEPGILVTGSRGGSLLRGLDRTTGEYLWTAPVGGSGSPLLQVAGVLVSMDSAGATMRAVDVGDGTLRWTAPATREVWTGPLTDGSLVVAATMADGRPVLVARDLADGEEAWRSALPTGVGAVFATPTGDVIALTPTGVVGLG